MIPRPHHLAFALVLALLALAPAVHAQRGPGPARGSPHATAAARPADSGKRVGWRGILATARSEFQLFRGDRLERWANRIKIGKSDFDGQRTVTQNLEDLVAASGLEHYNASVGGREVLHIVVPLGEGDATKGALRAVMKRAASQTIELNYKAPAGKNPYGHVAVRVGDGAFYDLTGTQGVSELPPVLSKMLGALRGSRDLSFARKRNLRRFMEGRTAGPEAEANVYYGLLFAASADEQTQTKALYDKRIGQVSSFNVNGGDGAKGEYSCAQFLTEEVPFFNQRGIGRNIGATSTASSAGRSLELQAVVVYKAAATPAAELTHLR